VELESQGGGPKFDGSGLMVAAWVALGQLLVIYNGYGVLVHEAQSRWSCGSNKAGRAVTLVVFNSSSV
jgi:hypothetical protein